MIPALGAIIWCCVAGLDKPLSGEDITRQVCINHAGVVVRTKNSVCPNNLKNKMLCVLPKKPGETINDEKGLAVKNTAQCSSIGGEIVDVKNRGNANKGRSTHQQADIIETTTTTTDEKAQAAGTDETLTPATTRETTTTTTTTTTQQTPPVTATPTPGKKVDRGNTTRKNQ